MYYLCGLQALHVTSMKKFLLLITIVFLTAANTILAQNVEVDRPSIGLALSGGAAHGFAHIGVIKYLDEIGLEVDNITGTSMGSVIGGLYAMGYSADEIAHIAANQDWKLIMSNHTPLYEVAPIEKQFHEKIPLSIFWNEDSFTFPSGLIKGQKLDLIITKIYAPAYFINDYDLLHIPYRCMAVDIENGTKDVLSSGFLGESIRASMAIPSVFPPKDIDGKLYVDGGLLRNFPVQENFDMGSQKVIGVYVGSEVSKREDLKSSFDIFKQSIWLGSILDSKEQSKLADILIKPDVKEIGSFDFDKYEEFIRLGYEKTKEQAEALKAMAKEQAKHPKRKRRPKLNNLDYLRFSKISTSVKDPVLQKMISNNLKFGTRQNVSFRQLEESLALVFGTKNFSKTSYDFDINEEGIELIVETEDVKPYTLGVSLNRFKNYNASLILMSEVRNVFGKPSSLRLDGRISENPGIQGSYYYRFPFEPSYLLNLRAKYEDYELPFFNDGEIDRLYKAKDGHLEVGVSKEWKNKYLFSLSYEILFNRLRSRVFIEDDFQKLRSNREALNIGLQFNSLNRQFFAKSGQKFDFKATYVFSNNIDRINQGIGTTFLDFPDDKNYVKAEFSYQNFYSISGVVAEFESKGRISSGQTFLDNFNIGGPIQSKSYQYGFTGLDDFELIMGDHISGRFGLRFSLNDKFFITPQINYLYGENFLSYAYNNTDKNLNEVGMGISLSINSPIGPVVLDIGINTDREEPIANIGFGYRHIL